MNFGLKARVSGFLSLVLVAAATGAEKPNVVFVMCDDLGYGDVSCLNPEHGKIATPAVDRLAKEGMIFTDAHSGSSVCTPTRYGLLTGRYSWRTHLQRGVVQGFGPCLIAPDRPTVASFFRDQGYHTGIVGKWHLNFEYKDGETGALLKQPKGKDRTKEASLAPVGSKIPDGPIHRGFDYYHGFHHAREMKVVIENDTVIAHDEEINMLPRITARAVEYIDQRTKDKPFFLYVPYGSPHTPIVPTKEWQGKSGLGDYADFVMETDAGFGEILAALDRNGFRDNTLVIFTSDNGCSRAADIDGLKEKGHLVSAHLRGSKADLWDGGHRVPFIARWPGKIANGSKSDELVCLVDFFATCAELLGISLPENGGEDSVSFLPAFLGESIQSTRDGVIHHSISGHFGYRQGKWKLLLARGSGGWSAPNEGKAIKAGAPGAQLYDLDSDPGETTNLYETHPEEVAHLLALLKADVERGRSVEGPTSQNDVPEVKLWKSSRE